MVSHWILYLVGLAGCTVFYCCYQQWLGWVLLVGVLALPLLSLVVSLPAILTTRVEVDSPATVPIGGRARAGLFANGRLPLPPVTGKLALSCPLYGSRRVVRGGAELATGAACGIRCQVKKARVYDYLGLFFLPIHHRGETVTLVLPDPIPVEGEILAQPTAFRPKPGGGFCENHDLRLYRPGDNLQQIHWKMSAKTGKRIYREPIEPIRKKIAVTLCLYGSPEELTDKLGRLRWLGEKLTGEGVAFDVYACTGAGVGKFPVACPRDMDSLMRELLLSTPAPEEQTVTVEGDTRYIRIGGDSHGV